MVKDLEKISLNFSRCTKRNVAPLIKKLKHSAIVITVGNKEKQSKRIEISLLFFQFLIQSSFFEEIRHK